MPDGSKFPFPFLFGLKLTPFVIKIELKTMQFWAGQGLINCPQHLVITKNLLIHFRVITYSVFPKFVCFIVLKIPAVNASDIN